MKRFINIYSTALSALLLLAGCTAELRTDDDEAVKSPHVKLTVSLPGANTKGDTIDGEDDWNENKVTSVYYFFYKDGSDTDAPKMSGHFAGLSLSGEGATKTWTIPTSADMIANQLFPSGLRECQTFVVANPPASLITTLDAQEKTITLKALRELTFSTTLTGKQDSFVMVWDGKSEVGSRTGTTAMDVDAELRRVANKITVNVNVASEYYDKEGGWKRWEPEMSTLKVEFYNGMSKANLCGDFSKLTVNADTDYFTSNESSFGTATGADKYFYMEVSKAVAGSATELSAMPATVSSTSPATIKIDTLYYKLEQYQKASSEDPFYTYPMTWEFASATEPFLMFELTWTPHWVDEGGQNHQGTSQTCYYKLMLSQKSMTTNGWYDVTADLRVLGSFDKFAPTQQYLHEDYVVLEWINAFVGTNNNVDAEIKDAHYLVVNQDHYELNNQKTLSIPFISSHPCKIGSVTVTRKDFKTDAVIPVTPGSDWVTVNGSVIEFKHELDNDWDSANLDVSPYYFTITLQHQDDATYSETITITQYPAVYIQNERNSKAGVTGSHGNAWINGNGASSSGIGWRYVGDNYTAGGLEIPNMTIITVSQLDSDMDYVIGDPRVKTTLDANNYPTWWNDSSNYPVNVKDSHQYYGTGDNPDTGRRMKYYYETGGAGYENFIAPKFRLVSGYSYNNGARSYKNNLMRCATYQEDGYPAGRWRIPTRAEIEFIKKIEAKGLILSLFVGTTNYWYPTGYVNGTTFHDVTNPLSSSTTACTRCVYDEWYWGPIDAAAGNDHSTKTFYWGDQPL